jgi:2-polyprenyl-3-methyl-5-hydroxy-6-metoxy-1,4-benzoquinol methylase
VEYAKRNELKLVSQESAEEAMVARGRIAESFISLERPELIDLFLTYQNEAVAARKLLESSLIELDSGAEILEVGGGILALAIQLASEGFAVTTVEPIGKGFTGISFIMNVFSEIARKENLKFNLIETSIEDCVFNHDFDFIFSINVMEHLNDPYAVLIQMNDALKLGGKYRFFCPNYDFPYEPHFSKWLWRRRHNSFYLESSRANGLDLDSVEQKGLYDSLNFITLRKLKLFSCENEIQLLESNSALTNLINRALHDLNLQRRHKSLAIVLAILKKLGLLRAARLLSPNFQPIIDATIISQNKTKSKSTEF